MRKQDRENYIFSKKALLLHLFMYYYADVSYDCLVLRSFGFNFDPSCNYKTIIRSQKGNIHKYVTRIYHNTFGVNFQQLDEMGNINIVKVKKVRDAEFYLPSASLNIYSDGAHFFATGYLEGKKIDYTYAPKKDGVTDDLLYHLGHCQKLCNINHSANTFVLWLMKMYTSKLPVNLVMGAGINVDYGAKTWLELMNSLNNDFYQGDYKFADEIEHYVGKELFTSSMVLQTSGFDSYESLNRELYMFDPSKSFDDPDSTLYHCVDYIASHKGVSVITYNYDTNLEYLLKKHGIRYTVVYDDNAFNDKESGVSIYHVHGLLPFDKYKEKKYTDSLIFNESEYYYLYNNPYSWNIAKQLHDFKFNACIFIGISLTDPDMKRLLELALNYLKFNFIFLKKENGYSETVYRDLTSYFFTFDLIVIWIDDYSEIKTYLESL